MGIHATSPTPQEPDGREFMLRVTPAVALNACVFTSFQTGAFGGYGSVPVRNVGGGGSGFGQVLAASPSPH